MKVLYDHQAFDIQEYGGVSRYFHAIISQYKKNTDIECDLQCAYSNNEYLLTDNSFKVKRFFPGKSFLLKQQIMHSLNKSSAVHQIHHAQFDLFHPTYYDTYFLKHLKSKPFVLTIHDMIHEIFPQYFSQNDATVWNKKYLAEKASKIIAISESTKTNIMEYYKLDESKIEVIYHGSPLIKETCSNKNISLPEKYILYVGTRPIYKNFNVFIHAISDLLIKQHDLFLVCAGGGLFSANELKVISELGIEHKVKYHSASPDVLATVYARATCFCFTTLYEGFGFPTLEAFGCGCPVALSNSSSLPEVGGDAAEYFDPTSKDSIKSSIEKIIGSESLRKEMIKKGEKRFKDFSWSKTAAQTMKVYSSVLK